LQLRTEVFVVEQRCAYQEVDGQDLSGDTLHLMAGRKTSWWPTCGCSTRVTGRGRGDRARGDFTRGTWASWGIHCCCLEAGALLARGAGLPVGAGAFAGVYAAMGLWWWARNILKTTFRISACVKADATWAHGGPRPLCTTQCASSGLPAWPTRRLIRGNPALRGSAAGVG
jgi:hypothetical protein